MNIYTHLTSLKQNVVQKMRDVQVNRFQSEERKTRIKRHTGESKMVKIEVGKLKIDDLFEYKGVIYEVMYIAGWSVRCRYVNDKCNYGTWLDYHLYCDFSIHTIVEI